MPEEMSCNGTEQHVYHHNDGKAKVSVGIERNTKGYNWSVSVSNASSVQEALALLEEARTQMANSYGEPV